MRKDVEYINSPIEQTIEVGYAGVPKEYTATVGSDDVHKLSLAMLDERYEPKMTGVDLLAVYELERGNLND